LVNPFIGEGTCPCLPGLHDFDFYNKCTVCHPSCSKCNEETGLCETNDSCIIEGFWRFPVEEIIYILPDDYFLPDGEDGEDDEDDEDDEDEKDGEDGEDGKETNE